MYLAHSGIHCSSKMTVWWQALILLCCILNCVDSAPSHDPKQKYNNSFRLTRSTRTRVQQLLQKYEQHLANAYFEDRGRQLKELPVLSTDVYSWLTQTDWDRLHAAFWDMQAYWNMLEWERKRLEREQTVDTKLALNIKHIQLDLRDLMNQVSSQMSYIKGSWVKPTSPSAQMPLNPETSSKKAWDHRVEGYIILRDLGLYLTKLARDFLLLASKIH